MNLANLETQQFTFCYCLFLTKSCLPKITMSNAAGVMENLLTCPISFDRYHDIGDHIPYQLLCGHTMCLDCIKKLAQESENKVSIIRDGGVETLLCIFKQHQTNPDLMKTACGILWSIGSMVTSRSEVIELLLSIIYQHPGNIGVLKQARGALSQIQ